MIFRTFDPMSNATKTFLFRFSDFLVKPGWIKDDLLCIYKNADFTCCNIACPGRIKDDLLCIYKNADFTCCNIACLMPSWYTVHSRLPIHLLQRIYQWGKLFVSYFLKKNVEIGQYFRAKIRNRAN